MLHRLLDPETSTRRTPAARRRLAEHPMTTALLDAGLRLLLEGFDAEASRREGSGERREQAPQLFAALSASRVCAVASALGPLRVTPGHLRDRWPHHDAFVEDLLAYGVWEQHWSAQLKAGRQAIERPAGAPGAGDLGAVADDLAHLNLFTGRAAVTFRVELVAAVLAPSRPALRAWRARGYAHLDAVHSVMYVDLLARFGLRLRPGADLDELTFAIGALAEGANLRLMAHGEAPEAHAAAVSTLARGGLLLAGRYVEPSASPSLSPSPGGIGRPWPPEPASLADVLVRLTDPESGSRRTPDGRRRLAEDPLTRQLLDGGISVLAEEFGLPMPHAASDVSHVFDRLSVARVVAEARRAGGAGAGATPGRLRDRWAQQEHYVDDLVSHALDLQQSSTAEMLQHVRPGEVLADSPVDVVRRRLRCAQAGAGARLRVLVVTLARTRPGVAEALRRLYEREERDLADLLRTQLDDQRLVLRDDLDLDIAELSRWLLALGDGAVVRLLATGSEAVGDGASLVRAGLALVEAATEPDQPR